MVRILSRSMRGNGALSPVRVAASELVVVSNLFCKFGPLPAIRMHDSNSASAWCSLYCSSARLLEVNCFAVKSQSLLYYIFDQLATFLKDSVCLNFQAVHNSNLRFAPCNGLKRSL